MCGDKFIVLNGFSELLSFFLEYFFKIFENKGSHCQDSNNLHGSKLLECVPIEINEWCGNRGVREGVIECIILRLLGSGGLNLLLMREFPVPHFTQRVVNNVSDLTVLEACRNIIR